MSLVPDAETVRADLVLLLGDALDETSLPNLGGFVEMRGADEIYIALESGDWRFRVRLDLIESPPTPAPTMTHGGAGG